MSPGEPTRHSRSTCNRTLYMICLARMDRDRRTQEYVAKHTAQGKSRREIRRWLKRYVARVVYRVLISCVACCSPLRALDEGTPPVGAAPLH
jgi:transposase